MPDTLRYLVELHRFRPKVGLSLINKSPIYWTVTGYDLCMRALYRGAYEDTYRRGRGEDSGRRQRGGPVLRHGRLYRHALRGARALVPRPRFQRPLRDGRRASAACRRASSTSSATQIPHADYVVMCSSLYHVRSQADLVLARMRAAAKVAVIISEPVSNLSHSLRGAAGKLAAALTNPGVGEYGERFDRESFEAFARANSASEFECGVRDRNALAVFPGQAPSEWSSAAAQSPAPARA